MNNGILDVLMRGMSQSAVPKVIARYFLERGPIHLFGLQIEKIGGPGRVINEFNGILVMLFAVLIKRINPTYFRIIIQDNPDVFSIQ